MFNLVFLGLALLLVQTFIPALYKATTNGVMATAGPQDDLKWSTPGDRSQRALRNLLETFPIFVALAILALIAKGDVSVAATGAVIYLLARVVYIPSFIFGVLGLRSVAYIVSLVGLGMMAFSVFQHFAV